MDLTGIRGDMTRRSKKVRERILQWTGIPCGIGIGPTKTLAKLANFIAKTAERRPGSYPEQHAQVCNLGSLPQPELHALLAATEVGEVWGVGRKIGKQLQDAGIQTVLDLQRLDPAMVKRRWSVVLERTVRELQGTPCIEFEQEPAAQPVTFLHLTFPNVLPVMPDASSLPLPRFDAHSAVDAQTFEPDVFPVCDCCF